MSVFQSSCLGKTLKSKREESFPLSITERKILGNHTFSSMLATIGSQLKKALLSTKREASSARNAFMAFVAFVAFAAVVNLHSRNWEQPMMKRISQDMSPKGFLSSDMWAGEPRLAANGRKRGSSFIHATYLQQPS